MNHTKQIINLIFHLHETFIKINWWKLITDQSFYDIGFYPKLETKLEIEPVFSVFIGVSVTSFHCKQRIQGKRLK